MHRRWILGVATLLLGTTLGISFAQPQSGDEPIVPNPNAPPLPATASPTASASPSAAVSPAPTETPQPQIYISDTGNHRIVRIDNFEGANPHTLGRPGHGPGYFLYPAQVWVDPLGKIYVADRDNNRIVRMDSEMNGKGWMEMEAGLNHPEGVASRGDEFYVADTGNNQVLVFTEMNGKPIRTYKDPRLEHPTSLWLDQNKHLYVTCGQDPPGGRVVKIIEPPPPPPPDPKKKEEGAPKPEPAKAETRYEVYEGANLRQVGFSPSGFVNWKRQFWMVCPVSSRLIRVDNFQGRSAREWGGYGAALGKFRAPTGLGLTQDGRLLVADSGNDRIVEVNGLDPKEWRVFAGIKDGVGLRNPVSVFCWSPVPKPPPPPEDDKDKKGKDS